MVELFRLVEALARFLSSERLPSGVSVENSCRENREDSTFNFILVRQGARKERNIQTKAKQKLRATRCFRLLFFLLHYKKKVGSYMQDLA